MRRRALDPAAPVDIDAFLDIGFREYGSLVHKSAAALAAAAFMIAADLHYFRIADETGVRYSNYGRFVEARVSLGELDRVELGCAAPDPDKRYRGPRLRYVLVKEGAFRFDVMPDWGVRDRIGRLEDFDRAVVAAGVPVMRAVRADPLSDSPGFIETCADKITARYEPDIAARLMRADAPAP